MKLEKTLVDLVYNGKSLTSLSAKNTMDIKYTLASEDNKVIRDIEVDDSGNHFIEAEKNDSATFLTQYPETLVEGLYWGKGRLMSPDVTTTSDSAYLYTSEDTVTISNGVALDGLELNRLPMLSIYIRNVNRAVVWTLKSISIDGVEVAKPDKLVTNSNGYWSLESYIENYMSYNTTRTVEYSVVVNAHGVDTTLTASVDLSEDSNVVLDGSNI